MAQPVDAPIPDHDPRAADLQAQIDDLRLALLDWRRSREHSQPTEDRLAQITLQCARMVDTWQEMERRRPGGIAGFDPGRGVESRLHQATGERLRALERAIEHEWNTLPQGRDETSRQLTEHAAGLGDTRVAAASLTLRGLAGVETRLTALEQDLQAGMAQLSRELQSVVTELRNARAPHQPGAATGFPLESVMRIHEELRESDPTRSSAPEALKSGAVRALPQSTEVTTALTARVESLERAVSSVAEATEPPRSGWRPLYTILGMIVIMAGVALFGLWMQRRVDARLTAAAQEVAEAERQRDATTAAIRAEAAREVAEARESAAQAQIVGNVLAAPDLVRYWLTGPGDSRAYAQVLFSRSRGMVFSGSRLEPAGAGRTYQLWLLTVGDPVNAGLITPDSAGRVTFATDVPLTVPSRLTGALVTVEAAGGGAVPSGERVLIRAQ